MCHVNYSRDARSGGTLAIFFFLYTKPPPILPKNTMFFINLVKIHRRIQSSAFVFSSLKNQSSLALLRSENTNVKSVEKDKKPNFKRGYPTMPQIYQPNGLIRVKHAKKRVLGINEYSLKNNIC